MRPWWRRVLCATGWHRYESLHISVEYVDYQAGDRASVMERCGCGEYRIVRYEMPAWITSGSRRKPKPKAPVLSIVGRVKKPHG